ncbi:MAG: FapA family protein [Oscillospiraceae bacterium]|nr:FapA family protein [Oscillospiraceae bacterium]
MENDNTNAGANPFNSAEAAQEPIDGVVQAQISEDLMSAYVAISRPLNGGIEVTVQDILSELELLGVKVELNREAIDSLVNLHQYNERVCVARGKAPINGTDGDIFYKYAQTSALQPKENEKGVMDYKDLGLVQNILAGTLIAELVDETEGEDGFDVLGILHKPMPGKPAKYLVGKGTVLSEDKLRITAEIDGNLRWHRDHFTVESTLVIAEDVGATTGNIDFIGDVLVKGMVQENFSVVSKKNILINGSATNAKIVAEGNIEIKMGSINSEVSAQGDVKIGFCESSKIDCVGDLSSSSFVACDVFCQGVASATSGKGIIVGGKMTCLKGIIVNTAGSESYTKTKMILGNGAILSEEKLALEKEEADLTEQIGKLVQLSDMLKDHKKKTGSLPPDREDMLSKAIRTKFKYSNDIKLIQKRIEEIDVSLLSAYNLQIEVRKSVWPGVAVKIGTTQIKIEHRSDRCRIYVNDAGDIDVKPITGPTG